MTQGELSTRFNLLAAFPLLHLFASQVTAQISILSDTQLGNQRDCVRGCFGLLGHRALWDSIGCPNANSCLCRPDMRASASSRLSYCILTEWKTCTDGTDIGIATSIYDRYCSFTEPATVIVTPTPSAAGRSNSGPVTVTAPAPATKTLYTSAPMTTVYSSSPHSSGTRLSACYLALLSPATATIAILLHCVAFRAWI